MSVIRTARRRRKQMQNGYTHIPAKSRPRYRAANRATVAKQAREFKIKK